MSHGLFSIGYCPSDKGYAIAGSDGGIRIPNKKIIQVRERIEREYASREVSHDQYYGVSYLINGSVARVMDNSIARDKHNINPRIIFDAEDKFGLAWLAGHFDLPFDPEEVYDNTKDH